jgi:hypothetical protein
MRPPEQFVAKRLKFIGEQDGPTERTLKDRFVEFFKREGEVRKAYLARITYEGSDSLSVALCLYAGSVERGLTEKAKRDLVENVGKIFASIFGRQQHMDIMFVTKTQVTELDQCCRPFFDAEG